MEEYQQLIEVFKRFNKFDDEKTKHYEDTIKEEAKKRIEKHIFI